jgi:hypothetical protein
MLDRVPLLLPRADRERPLRQKRFARRPFTDGSVWLLLAALVATLFPRNFAHGQTGPLVAQRKPAEPEEEDEDGKPDAEEQKAATKPAPSVTPAKPAPAQGTAAEAAKGPAREPQEGLKEMPSEEALEEAKKSAKNLEEEEALQEASDVARAKALWERIEFGGALEAEYVWNKNYGGKTSSELALRTAEFDFAVKAVDWAVAVLAAEWDPDADKITLNEALITLGKLRKFPFLLEIARSIVPFGIATGSTVAARLEDILTISDPLSKAIFESKQDHVLLRFRHRGFTAAGYVFNGKTNRRGPESGKKLDHYGGTVGYAAKSGDLAYSLTGYFIDSVFDSESLLSAYPEALYAPYVPGVAAVLRLAWGGFTLAGEYDTGTSHLEFVRNGQSFSIRPSAWMAELGYTTRIFRKRSYAAFGYSETYQLASAFPKRRLLPTLGVWLFGGFRLAVEYRIDYDYTDASAEAFTFRLTYEW